MPSSNISIDNSGGSTSVLSQVIAGTVEGVAVGSPVFIYDNQSDVPIGTACVATDGTWSADIVLSASDNIIVARTMSDSGSRLDSNPVDLDFEPVLSPPSSGQGTSRSLVRVPPSSHRTSLAAEAGPEVFVFAQHPGHVRLAGLDVAGADHDRVRLSGSGFTSVADVLSHVHSAGHGAVLTLGPHDSITLANVTAHEVRSHPGIFSLHP